MTHLYQYEFCYRLILRDCPDYIQYLQEEIEVFDQAPFRQRLHNLAVEPRAYTETDGLSEEELAVIREMHSHTDSPRETTPDPWRLWQQMDSSEKKPNEYCLKREYRDWKHHETSTVPLLPPPNKYLDVGSIFFRTPNIMYLFQSATERNADVVHILSKKVSYTHPKVRMVKAVYRFDRGKDVTSEIRKKFSMIVFNLDTYRLYHLSRIGIKVGKSNRYKQVARQYFLNLKHFAGIIPSGNWLQRRFYDIICKHATSIMPDIYHSELKPDKTLGIKYENLEIALTIIMIQMRVGRPLPWMEDENRLNNMLSLAHTDKLFELVTLLTNKHFNSQRFMDNYKRRTIYKMVDRLKENPKPKTILKTILSENYRELYYKLMLTWMGSTAANPHNRFPNLMKFIAMVSKGLVPNSLYHFVSYLIKSQLAENPLTAHKYIYECMNNMSFDLTTVRTDGEKRSLHHSVTTYTKLAKRFLESGDDSALRWTTFRDAMEMAKNVNIRVRPNKFQSVQEVMEVHDTLAAIQNRNLSVESNYAGKKFLVFESPDKEYAGFKFTQLLTPEELLDEGTNMHHCVGGYADKCLRGRSIIFSMNKDGRSWVTIELRGSEARYPINQRYTIKDFTVTNPEILQAIEDWHNDVVQMHREDLESGKEELYFLAASRNYQEQLDAEQKERLDQANNQFKHLLDGEQVVTTTAPEPEQIERLNQSINDLRVELHRLREEDEDATTIEQEYALASQ